MNPISIDDPKAAARYIESLNLPRPPVELEHMAEKPAPPPVAYKAGEEQAVTIGSQIAGFAAEVPTEIRPQISNSFLLAQLAANREIKDNNGGTKEWYNRYVDVLVNTGWLVESSHDSMREISGISSELHEEIIPVLAAALGPAVAATAIVMTVLKGLAEMDKDKPWITLFDRESQRASANQFQVSYAEVDESKNPRITLVCFELDASRSLTQILFFKFSSTKAKLFQFGAKLGINPAVFKAFLIFS